MFVAFGKRVNPSAAICLFLIPLCLLAFWIPKMTGAWGLSEHLPMVTSEFLAGAFLRRGCGLSKAARRTLQRLLPFTTLSIIAILCVPPDIVPWNLDRVALVLLFPPLIGGLWNSASGVARLLSTPLIVYLGHISYALYLVHAIVQKLFLATLLNPALHADSQWWRIGAFVLYLLAPLIAASILYHLIEEPCRKWIRHHWRSETKGLSNPAS
ncbi:MAG: acyltransferase [Verrucomicrobia bacterium]|nr:acyltransferase [Verrucomicrobiota bacterium]